MDSLIPWERAAKQGELFPAKDRLDAYATPKQRQENAAFLARAFHVVVGNPPYITPPDDRKRDDYRLFWPVSCYMEYVLSVPFIERWFSPSAENGYLGKITSSSFARRGYGKRVITNVLPRFNVRMIVDASRARIPGHNVSTLILYARKQRADTDAIRVVVGLRGESRKKHEGSFEGGTIWNELTMSSVTGISSSGAAVTSVSRSVLGTWPWSLGDAIEPSSLTEIDPGCAHRN
jgi:hypothetical protein